MPAQLDIHGHEHAAPAHVAAPAPPCEPAPLFSFPTHMRGQAALPEPDSTTEGSCSAMSILDEARARADARPEPRRIDYDRKRRGRSKQKAALTRAVNSGDAEKVAAVCKAAVAEWDACGAWPDDWNRWQNALNDACGGWPHGVELRDL